MDGLMLLGLVILFLAEILFFYFLRKLISYLYNLPDRHPRNKKSKPTDASSESLSPAPSGSASHRLELPPNITHLALSTPVVHRDDEHPFEPSVVEACKPTVKRKPSCNPSPAAASSPRSPDPQWPARRKKMLNGCLTFLLLYAIIAGIAVVLAFLPNWLFPSKPATTPSGNDRPSGYVSSCYIGNIDTKKFHHSYCPYLPDKDNQIEFDYRDDAIDAGYDPCGHCNP